MGDLDPNRVYTWTFGLSTEEQDRVDMINLRVAVRVGEADGRRLSDR